jgi:hypothetical protein
MWALGLGRILVALCFGNSSAPQGSINLHYALVIPLHLKVPLISLHGNRSATTDCLSALQLNAHFIGERTDTKSIEHGTWMQVRQASSLKAFSFSSL